MAKKFSELAALSLDNFSDNDILAATDISDILSRRLTFGDMKSYIAGDVIGDGLLSPEQIIVSLNTHNATLRGYTALANTSVYGLDADLLDGNQGEFYLDYGNFANTPVVPTELGQLDNTSGYLTFNTTLERIEYRQIVDGVDQGATTFTADFVPEGETNFYYTTNRFLTDLDQNLASRLAQTLTVFFDGSLNDNLIKCNARMVDFVTNQSDQLDLVEFVDQFNDGQKVRIYGANVDNSSLQDLDKDFSIIQVTRNFFAATGTTNHTISYKIAEMDLLNGNISTAGTEVSVGLGSKILGDGTEDLRQILNQFDDNYNISIRFAGTNTDKAVLLYRKVSSPTYNTDYKLYAVLGPKDIQNNVYIDYGTYDYVPWGPKSEVDNTFSTQIHVPITPPANTIRGWADVTIIQTDYAQNRIRFEPALYGTQNQNVNIAHNDTQKIQDAVDYFVSTGRSALTLNDKIYSATTVALPANFAIKGTPGVSKIIKLPWSSHEAAIKSNNIFKFNSGVNSNVSIQDVIIDGAAQYQINLLDTTDETANYTINYGTGSDTCTVVNVKMSNILGGGLFAEQSQDLRVNLCEFKDSGTTDRYDYSPAKASESTNLMITNSRFSNFSDSLDASVSTKGVVTNNVVSNCGEGILVYGSSFLITNPNVILGPANELLQSADALNSVFDSVNIRLNEGQAYESDVYRYQVNGANYDLTADNGVLSFLIYKLEKNSIGVENLYEEVNGPDFPTDPTQYMAPVYDVNIQGSDGLFKFKITQPNVTGFLNTYEYDALKAANPDHVGMVYAVNLKTEHLAGIVTTGDVSVDNTYTYDVAIASYENISVGDEVYLLGHQGYDLGDPELSETGTIIDITEDPASGTALVSIEYADTANITPGTDNTGYLYLYRNTTIVKGRVL